MPLFRFFLLLLPLLELATLILLGQRIGVGYTLLWVLGSGVLGLVLIQRQGWSMLQQLQIRMAENRSPFAVLKTGMWWLLAGVLLMIPGLITDALALPSTQLMRIPAKGLFWAQANCLNGLFNKVSSLLFRRG